MNKEMPKIKPLQERDNLDLLELVCQLHARANMYGTKEVQDAYIEARKELEKRLSPVSVIKDVKSENEKLKKGISTINKRYSELSYQFKQLHELLTKCYPKLPDYEFELSQKVLSFLNQSTPIEVKP